MGGIFFVPLLSKNILNNTALNKIKQIPIIHDLDCKLIKEELSQTILSMVSTNAPGSNANKLKQSKSYLLMKVKINFRCKDHNILQNSDPIATIKKNSFA